jgi:NADP-dependent 3-hydroxy acid dehydrogenase YdfG
MRRKSKEEEMAEKIWFVTGASRGFGRLWTEAALARGDKVAATARDTAVLSDLSQKFGDNVLPLELDVTNPNAVTVAVNRAHRHFGRLDVILTNAGYGLMGALEETTIEEARAAIRTCSARSQPSKPHCRCFAHNGADTSWPFRASAGL